MGKGDEFKEYKKSKLTSGDIGIRIIGTTENLEFIRNLFGENFRLPLSSQINKLKSKKKYKKSEGKKWDKEIRIVGTMEDLEQMEKLLKEEFSIARISDIYKWGTANISEILYAKLYFHLKKPKTCTLRIWLFC